MAEDWRSLNRDKYNATARLRAKNNPEQFIIYQLRRRAKEYGLDPVKMEQLYFEHDGLCDICGETAPSRDPRSRRLCMDHDHEEGYFRGFICRKCNLALGYMNDNPKWLREAADYLERVD